MATIDCFVARHFWQGGEHAVWQESGNFPPPLLAWLKSHYTELVTSDRLPSIERPEGVVYLFYKDEREAHGRMATRLTACWTPEQVINHKEVIASLRNLPDLVAGDRLKYKLAARIKKKPCLPRVIGGIVLLTLLLGSGVLYLQLSQRPTNEEHLVTSIEAISVEKNIATPQLPEDNIESTSKPLKICDLIIKEEVKPTCLQKFIKNKCSNQTSLSYRDWSKESYRYDPNLYVNDECEASIKSSVASILKQNPALEKFNKSDIKRFIKGQ